MSIFKKFFSWFKKAAKNVEHEAAKIAVVIVEAFKAAQASGALNVIESIASALDKTGISTKVIESVKTVIPNVLSIVTGLEGPPENATAEQIAAWSDNVLKAVGVSADQFYSVLGANLAKRIQVAISEDADHNLSFAQWVAIVEDTFQDYKAHEPHLEDFPVDHEQGEKTA